MSTINNNSASNNNVGTSKTNEGNHSPSKDFPLSNIKNKEPLLLYGGDLASTGRISISCGAIDTPLYRSRIKKQEQELLKK
ncbi:hypothetical protein ABK040_009411 [Willaertia magna]